MVQSLEHDTVGLAFDGLAEEYDRLFTFSAVGRSQRDVVWKHALAAFAPSSHILELNCGTGEDALFLAKAGMAVTACDASARMIMQARSKMQTETLDSDVEFLVLATEQISSLPRTRRFDGVFSNFSGLNCIPNLQGVAFQLAERLEPGTPLLLCLSTRYCLWEICYYLLRKNARKALRRCSGSSQARVGEFEFSVYYPTPSDVRRAFAPHFRLLSIAGIGITVPPSYLESWIARHPRLLTMMEKIDAAVRRWPLLRSVGDHMLLHLERV
jgi:SAM-dependent methyltransferase